MIPNRNQESISEMITVSGLRYLCGRNEPSMVKEKRMRWADRVVEKKIKWVRERWLSEESIMNALSQIIECKFIIDSTIP